MHVRTFIATTAAIACSLTVLQAAEAASYRVVTPNNAIAQPNAHLQLAPLHVACAAAGSPDFVHYGLLTNDGPRPVPAGSKVQWVMGKKSGNYTFAASLPLHKAAQFDLHFTTAAAQACTATFVK
jgi:hypothetical protein